MKFVRKYIIIIIFIITILVMIFIKNCFFKVSVELTQLSSSSEKIMMGYFLKTNKNKIIVIDGGRVEDAEKLIKYINKNGGKVDYWFLTHAHNDHVGAFVEIVKNTQIQIENIYISLNDEQWYKENEPQRFEFTNELIEILKLDKIKHKVIEPKLNEIIKLDNIKAKILGIKNPEIIKNSGNEQSMVIKFHIGNKTLLILGDTGEQSSEKLLKNQRSKLKCDIVQMSHHGQRGATKQLYEEVKPSICLWPTPGWLWYNDSGTGYNSGSWETLDVRKWMENMQVKENYVAKDGDITIKIE